MVQKKRLIWVIAIVVWLYFMFLPFFWPTPRAKVSMATEALFDRDLEIRVAVSAWHSNVVIDQVRFYVDRSTTTAHGPKGPLYPVVLHNAPNRRHLWPFWEINRLTWPRSQVLTFTLPLRRLSQEQVVTRGIVRGTLNVTVSFPMPSEPLALWLGYTSVSRGVNWPFELQLV